MFLEKEVHPVSHDPGLGHGQLVEILAVGAPVSEPSPSRNLFRFLPIQHAGLPQVRAVGVEPRLPGKCHACSAISARSRSPSAAPVRTIGATG